MKLPFTWKGMIAMIKQCVNVRTNQFHDIQWRSFSKRETRRAIKTFHGVRLADNTTDFIFRKHAPAQPWYSSDENALETTCFLRWELYKLAFIALQLTVKHRSEFLLRDASLKCLKGIVKKSDAWVAFSSIIRTRDRSDTRLLSSSRFESRYKLYDIINISYKVF